MSSAFCLGERVKYYLYDANSTYVGAIDGDKGEKLLAEKKARIMPLKARHIQLRESTLDEYNTAGADKKTFYRERFTSPKRGSELVVLKRYDEQRGKFYKWDNSLTFDQLRAGVGTPSQSDRRESFAESL